MGKPEDPRYVPGWIEGPDADELMDELEADIRDICRKTYDWLRDTGRLTPEDAEKYKDWKNY